MNADLYQWLEALGLAQYAEEFEANDIDVGLLPRLTDQVLKDIGVASAGHRLRILGAVELLSVSTNKPTPTEAPDGLASQSALQFATEGERRHATVLFSDVSGYTAMNERLDPEAVTEVIGRIKTEAVRIVEAHGGIVNQFVGDEIVALFGIPAAHEDDPVRAVRAALALHEMVRRTSPQVEVRIGQTLRLHTGISTGLVVTNLRDRRDGTYGITGDAVNTGARLAAQAPIDEVLVSPHTNELVAGFFEIEALPPAILKGKAEPLTPYRIVRPTRAKTRFEAAQRSGLTGYAGRGVELTALLSCMERALSGEGQLVAVIGEAGAGKSRLAFEFRNSLDRERIALLEGRCQSYGAEIPYLPFLDALRRALDVREDDSPAHALDKIVTNVRALDPTLERFLPHYLHLLSIASEHYALPTTLQGAERKRACEDALAAIFTLGARRRPLVVLLEDWHWVDASSEAVLKQLVGLVARYPLMIVMLCRPEYDLKWAAPDHLTSIVLKPLSITDTRSMACAALGVSALPDDLNALIHERTGGNPLFIEEVCHTLVEQKIIAVHDGQAKVAQRIATVQLPDTVQAVIGARVDRLDAQGKELLRLASVIGREFARTLLERVAGASEVVTPTLEALKAQDLIRQVRVLPEAEYIFKHVLTQVVVYETLLLARRQALHELIGQATEELYADRLEEHYESLAYHYRHSENREKAIRYLELTADKAKAKYILEQALSSYRQAVDLLETLDKTPQRMRQHIDLVVRWADLIVPSAELIDALKRSQRYAEQLDDDDRLAKTTSFLGQMLFYVGAFDAAIPELKRVIGMAHLLEDQDRVGSCHRCLGQIYLFVCRSADAFECLETARPVARHCGNRFEESCCVGLMATEHGLHGRFLESASLFDEAIRIAQEGGEQSIKGWHFCWRSWVTLQRGRWEEVEAGCNEAIALGERIENAWLVTWASVSKGYAMFMAGNEQAGLSLARQAVQRLEESGALVQISVGFSWLSEMLYLTDHFDEAAAYADKAVAHLPYGSGWAAESRAYRARGMAAAKRPRVDWDAVDADMHRTLSNARTLGFRPDLAVSHFRYAELLLDRGHLPETRSQLEQADKLFGEMAMSWWSAQSGRLQTALEAQ